MAKVLTITKDDSLESIEKKIKQWSEELRSVGKAFEAGKYTGKVKSFGDGLAYQRKLRDEWD
jgi:hypothetical protein